VHIVATEPTVEVVMMYLNEVAPAFLELTARRRQIRAAALVLRDHRHEAVLDSARHESPTADDGEGQAELQRRSISLTIQSAQLLATSLLALRNEMGAPLDGCRYEQLWQVHFGKMEPIWKQDIEDLCPPPSSHLVDLVNRSFP